MVLLEDYFEMQKDYEQKFGPNTIVMMQKGSFFEAYRFDPTFVTDPKNTLDRHGNTWDEAMGSADRVSDLLRMILTLSDKSKPYSTTNCHMMGFPLAAVNGHIKKLVDSGFTVVKVEQKKYIDIKGKEKIDRVVSGIFSPSMQLDGVPSNQPTNNIACIYIYYQSSSDKLTKNNKYEKFIVTTGVSIVDIVTGYTCVGESHSKDDDEILPVQELFRFLSSYDPKELLLHIDNFPEGLPQEEAERYTNYLVNALQLNMFERLITRVNDVPEDYKLPHYQKDFLSKIFDHTEVSGNIINVRNERIIEELDLERLDYGRVAYMLLLQYCHSYNSTTIEKIKKPDITWIDNNIHLMLTHNAIEQLEVAPNRGQNTKKTDSIDTLLDVLDKTQTNLGRRSLHNNLLNPMVEPDKIQTHYDMIQEMLDNNVEDCPLWLFLERRLKQLPDIERFQRKLTIKTITPRELGVLYRSYVKIINIYISILGLNTPILHQETFTPDETNEFNTFMSSFCSIYDCDALDTCYIESSFEHSTKTMKFTTCPIISGVYQDIDEINFRLSTAEKHLETIVEHLNIFLIGTKGEPINFGMSQKKKNTNKDVPQTTILCTSDAKAKKIIGSKYNVELCGKITASTFTTQKKLLVSDVITALCHEVDQCRKYLQQRLMQIYDETLVRFNSFRFFDAVSCFVSKIDMIHSYAKVSYRNNYIRPTIIREGTDSFVEFKGLRHPIIERTIEDEYITADLSLGKSNNNDVSGMLLYGVNAAGKSSLGKAAALAVIMAQAGCYTACTMTYKPYHKIITRLLGDDNIHTGDSTFVVEMKELRTILRQADNKTLVIGDELCHGTETKSGKSITSSAIWWLINTRSSFIFATHMHGLLKLSIIKNIPREVLRVCHLSIVRDDDQSIIIYDRQLKDGSGPSTYGLMVAGTLFLPDEFMKKANEVMLEVMGETQEVMSTKKSKYNKKLYIHECIMCHQNFNKVKIDTHHLKEQHTADERGLIGSMHKNVKNNVTGLCEKCHSNLHRKGLELESSTTSTGKVITLRKEVPSSA